MEKICIVCPKGCRLSISQENGTINVTGNVCPRGVKYAEQEILDPRRVVTAVAPTDSANQPFLAVRTPDMVAKAKIPAILTKIYALRLKAPIAAGTVVIDDCDGEGTPVITCMDLD
jgi:CxxC motif-containing protein